MRVAGCCGDPAVGTIGGMGYDEVLAGRIRDLIGPDPELTEKKMFGGLAFLIRGHMAISASGQGGVLVHCDPAKSDDLVAVTPATVAVMQGREMTGWLRVAADHIATDEALADWVEIGLGHARSLPPKEPSRKSRKLRSPGS
jgi:TfoX N-terminal domain